MPQKSSVASASKCSLCLSHYNYRLRFQEQVAHVPIASPPVDQHADVAVNGLRDSEAHLGPAIVEQVAERLGVTRDRWRRLVALNDRGYIPAMAGATADRRAQGVTAAQEMAAETDLAERAEYSGDGQRRVKVWCPAGSAAAHADRLHGKAREIYGPRHRELAALFEGRSGTWCGGAPESGYFGIATPDEVARGRISSWWGDLTDGIYYFKRTLAARRVEP